MSYSIYLLRFVDGEVVALDAEQFRRMIEPYVVARSSEEGFSQLRAEDGGEADLYHASQADEGLSSVMATHFARGAMSGMLTRLAAALGASIVPQDGGALIFHLDDRRHLPAQFQEKAVVIEPTADAFQAALDAL
ncbi:hypothetical protein ACIHCX_07280 [Streptomyces sp. NPDC052043]|uniref:hypothetical protein n=1 Tax=Streptomyces sp. NPDC052043 TaxID=3365684 RepID=UPI0037D7EF3E